MNKFDLETPSSCSIRQAAGDTIGQGRLAHAMRSIPVIVQIAQKN